MIEKTEREKAEEKCKNCYDPAYITVCDSCLRLIFHYSDIHIQDNGDTWCNRCMDEWY